MKVGKIIDLLNSGAAVCRVTQDTRSMTYVQTREGQRVALDQGQFEALPWEFLVEIATPPSNSQIREAWRLNLVA